jgi:uncharacterized protein YbaP (TraB family)
VIHGEHSTVYLAGSVHLMKSADATLPPALDRAYSHSQTLVMELDLGRLSPRDATSWISAHGHTAPGSLRRALGEKSYERVREEARRLGMAPAALETEAPWVLGLQLLDLQYEALGYDPASGVEQQLEQRAHADGKATLGLETLADQLGVLGALTPGDQARFLMIVVSQAPDLEDDTRSVIEAWRAGDEAQLAAQLGQEYRSFPRLYRALVTQRNQHWLPKIERLLAGPQDCLVVVGALHLVGEDGLLELLRRDGHPATSL